uniref:Uncharacterized protein n=1 Tax=Davidia involucrata TaxID=16924 RepID=A0A5B7AE99_DAVIN
MLSSSPDLPQKSFQIKQDNKVFSRLLSKENSMANSSFRVYYGGVSGAVPFLWESQPGTPKYTFCDTTIPPLTPPPSYYCNNNTKPKKKNSISKLLHTLFLRINLKKAHLPSSSLSSSSWSSSHSSVSVPTTPSKLHGRSRFLSPRSSFDDRVDEEELRAFGSPNSTSCFNIGRDTNGGLRGGYSVVIMKKALLSMVGCGSS